jgi:SseB protein N-terminal domain
MTEFVPLNEFERALEQAQAGQLAMPALLETLVRAEVALPSASEVMDDGSGFEPLLFPKEGTQMLACFSDKSRIGQFKAMAPYCLVMRGLDLLRRVPPGFGVVFNPGWRIGFDISPDGIARILRDFTKS